MSERTPPLGGPIGRALSAIYAGIVSRRNRAFDAGRGVVTLDRPVISVGNLSVGGTGKTPLVAHVLELLGGAGRNPCVAMRGYGSGRGRESDEAMLYRDQFLSVRIVAQPDRVEGLLALFASDDGGHVDCVVLDDGFQHRRLARQVDLVLVDATRDPFADRLLPAGWLREPVAALKRATGVVITHAQAAGQGGVAGLAERIAGVTGSAPLAVCSHTWRGVRVMQQGEWREEPEAWLGGRRVVAAAAIGNPGPFLAMVRERVGVREGSPRAPVAFVRRDHDAFDEGTVRRLLEAAKGCDAIVTTAKDWTKLRRVPPERWPCPVAVPNLALRFERGAAELSAAVLGATAPRA